MIEFSAVQINDVYKHCTNNTTRERINVAQYKCQREKKKKKRELKTNGFSIRVNTVSGVKAQKHQRLKIFAS